MSELKVLSKEEVDALLNLTQESGDLSTLGENHEEWVEHDCSVNQKALSNIKELTIAECEKNFVSFLRKKITVKPKSSRIGKISECLEGKMEKHVYSIFKILPNEHYGMAVVDLTLLHHSINLLYGGQFTPGEPIIESPGKIGVLIAEKICEVGLSGFAQACGEYGQISFEMVKTILQPSLTSKISLDDDVYLIEMNVLFGETESSFSIMVTKTFISDYLPAKPASIKHVDSNFWRSAIENQVVDSHVMVHVTLPDLSVKVNDIVNFKSGDVIPIEDPGLVYICLNNLKLFRATAGQANSKRVVKVLSEV
jgi:flagellar motor switch protein FliM